MRTNPAAGGSTTRPAVSGKLRLASSGAAKQALAEDNADMLAIGMTWLDEDEPFGTLMQRCALIEERANAAQATGVWT